MVRAALVHHRPIACMESKTAQNPLYGGVVGGKKIKGPLLVLAFEIRWGAPSDFPSLEPIAGRWLHGI